MALHPFLERQIARASRQSSDGAPDLGRLFEAVSDTYQQMDRDRRLNDRAVALLQEELETLSGKWKDDAEQQIRGVMDFVGEAIISIDEHGTILAFNQAAQRVFDYQAEQVLGHNVKMLMTEKDAVDHDAFLARYMRSGQSTALGERREKVGRRQSGETFPMELNVGEMLAQGPGRRFIGLIRDISDRKKVEQELRESESRFRDLAGSASDWFWETDTEHRITFMSGRVREVLGIDPGALIGRDRFEAGLAGGSRAESDLHRGDLEQRRPFRDLVCRLDHPTRGAQTVRLSGIPIRDAAGTFLGYRGTGTNVTREMAAEQRAQQAQVQLMHAIESVTDGFALYDVHDRLAICNQQYRACFTGMGNRIVPGVAFSAVKSMALEAGLYAYEGPQAEEWLEARLAEYKHASGVPFLHKMKDGRWVESRDYRTRDGETVVVRTDVTALKTREIELNRVRRRFEMILQSAADGIIAYDSDGNVIFANQAATVMLGRSVEDLVGQETHSLFHHTRASGEPYPLEACPLHRAVFQCEEAEVSNEVFWRSNGTSFPVEYHVAPIIENGARAGAAMSFRDVTLQRQYEEGLANQQRELERLVEERTSSLLKENAERKRTQTALAASQNRLRSIADSLFEGVLVVDEHGHVIFANRSAQRLLHGEGARMAGQELDAFLMLLDGGQELHFADSPLRDVIDHQNTVNQDDAVFRAANGTAIPVAYACSPLLEDGKCRGAIISFRNIAVLKLAQQEAVQASRLASVGQLAAGIAHEINTPIQYIGDNLRFVTETFSQVISVLAAYQRLEDEAAAVPAFEPVLQALEAAKQDGELDFVTGEIPVALSQSLQGVKQVTEIVRSMKEFSHPGTASKVAADINRSIESTLTVSRNEWKHRARMELDLDPSLPLVTCLPGAINQVFLNLIINAADAISELNGSREGVIRISTRHQGNWAEIRIEDNGPGVPPDIKDRIFDPFFTTKEVGKGSGQGLMICRDVIVSKHNGKFYLDGEYGKGASFVVKLPIALDESHDQQA